MIVHTTRVHGPTLKAIPYHFSPEDAGVTNDKKLPEPEFVRQTIIGRNWPYCLSQKALVPLTETPHYLPGVHPTSSRVPAFYGFQLGPRFTEILVNEKRLSHPANRFSYAFDFRTLLLSAAGQPANTTIPLNRFDPLGAAQVFTNALRSFGSRSFRGHIGILELPPFHYSRGAASCRERSMEALVASVWGQTMIWPSMIEYLTDREIDEWEAGQFAIAPDAAFFDQSYDSRNFDLLGCQKYLGHRMPLRRWHLESEWIEPVQKAVNRLGDVHPRILYIHCDPLAGRIMAPLLLECLAPRPALVDAPNNPLGAVTLIEEAAKNRTPYNILFVDEFSFELIGEIRGGLTFSRLASLRKKLETWEGWKAKTEAIIKRQVERESASMRAGAPLFSLGPEFDEKVSGFLGSLNPRGLPDRSPNDGGEI